MKQFQPRMDLLIKATLLLAIAVTGFTGTCMADPYDIGVPDDGGIVNPGGGTPPAPGGQNWIEVIWQWMQFELFGAVQPVPMF